MNQDYQAIPPDRDPHLWQIAQRRASFKSHLLTYLVVNIFLWLIWYMTGAKMNGGVPWPAWSTGGWGIGLFFHFMGAYINTGNTVESEYRKLKSKQL